MQLRVVLLTPTAALTWTQWCDHRSTVCLTADLMIVGSTCARWAARLTKESTAQSKMGQSLNSLASIMWNKVPHGNSPGFSLLATLGGCGASPRFSFSITTE